MKIVKKLITELLPADYNPRKDLQPTDNEYKQLKRSIEEFGYVEPIIYNIQTGVVVGGHQRLKVLSDLGYSEVDCVEVDIDITKEKALNIALNKINGDWDEDKLKDLLSELQGLDFDMDLTGFTAEDLSDLNLDISVSEEKVAEEDNFDIDKEVEPLCKRGDIWVLGNHRLMCGDSTSKEDIDKLMGGDKVDMVFTDPPYGMNLNTDFSSMKGFTGGKAYDAGYVDDFKPEMIDRILSINAKETFIWGSDYFAELLPDKNAGSWVVWDKRANGNDDIEEDYSSDKMYGSCFELCWSKSKHKRDIARVKWAGAFGLEQEFDKKRVHPTQKPVKLCEWFFNRYSKENDLIVDLYGGSGSTLIACEQLNRKCRMMELDEHYCDVIIHRWETLTGGKAEKVE